MRKIICITFLLSFFTSNSQTERKFGVFAGATNPVFTARILEQVHGNFNLTPHLGIFYEMKLTNKIHFRPQLMYVNAGNWQTVSYSSYEAKYVGYHVNYMTIPLDVKFWNKTYVVIGPQIGFLVSKKNNEFNDENPKSSFDYGLNIGVGHKFKNFFLELDVYQGFNPILEIPHYTNRIELNNANARLTFGYYLF